MVAIAEPFRAQWEAEDEFRKIAEVEAQACWLRWFLGLSPATDSAPSSHDDVRNSDP